MIATLFLMSSNVGIATDDQPDPEFLEWLGLTSEVEELGVDVDRLISAQSEESKENPQQETTP